MPFKSKCHKSLRVNFAGDVYFPADAPEPDAALFAHVDPILAWAHANVINLEGVVTPRRERAFPDFPFALRIHAKTPALLAGRAIKHVTRANNHSMDFGLEGLRDTDKALAAEGIAWTGSGGNVTEALKPLLLERDGIRFGILAFTTTYPDGAWASESRPGVPYPTQGRLKAAIEALRKDADFLVVTFHWGEERSAELRPHQSALARIALSSGADAVVGHHAHVAQAIEKIDGKWAIYGLGNFFFRSKSPHTNLGLLASFEVCKEHAAGDVETRLALVPIDTLNPRTDYATRPMDHATFRKEAAPYFSKGLFPPDTPFRLLSGGKAWVAN
jgi:poly-gamma-glutamate capsule biosynthesis protein CapA/YwtB (metallophosphatase superfamily)